MTRSGLYPNHALSLADHPPVVLLAMCLFGEARGESAETRRAVAQVVVNRARHEHRVFGSQRGLPLHLNIVRVITKPCQFSCFLPSDVNYLKVFDPLAYESPAVWDECMSLAGESLATANSPDTLTQNSDHYFDESIQPPSWADPAKETVKIGRLRFFRLYLPALRAGSEVATPSGSGRAADAQPSPSLPSSAAQLAMGEALHPSLPATPASLPGIHQHGISRWLGGRGLSSLEAADRMRITPSQPGQEA